MIVNIFVLLTLIYLVYRFSVRNYDYWQKKGIVFPKPIPFLGNALNLITFRESIGSLLANFYNKFKTPYFGIYIFNQPVLVLRNMELIKHVLVNDFDYFPNHTVICDEKIDSVASKHLIFSGNLEWKFMRSKVTQAFSSGKNKNMFPLISAVTKKMNCYIAKNKNMDFIEGKELCAKYASDVMATCGFGINAHCFDNENAEFRVIGRKLFDFNIKNTTAQVCHLFAPGLVKYFKIRFMDAEVTNFMREIILSTMEHREKMKFTRNDVIDVMIRVKNNYKPQDPYTFEGDRIVGQAGQFFSAGIETVSATMSFTLYELCLHLDIQGRVRSEIRDNLAKYGELTYDGIQEMKYLNMVVCESLRKYPVLPFLDRMCVRDYRVPNSDFVIEKGTPVYVSTLGLHYDPDYYPDPLKYNPERFADENKSKLPNFAFIPFGQGPRSCVGARLGLLTTKLGLCSILSEFEVVRCAETPVPIVFEKKGLLLASTAGLPMKFRKLSVNRS